jgi:hypothetical protein
VAIAYGYNKLKWTVPQTVTIGSELPLNQVIELLRLECAMAGYTEVLTWALCSRAENFAHVGRRDDGATAVSISNPATAEFEVCRTSLLPGGERAIPLQLARCRARVAHSASEYAARRRMPCCPSWLALCLALCRAMDVSHSLGSRQQPLLQPLTEGFSSYEIFTITMGDACPLRGWCAGPGALKTLGANKDAPLPIKLFEVSDVILLDEAAETGARNERHLVAVLCSKDDGFHDVHGFLNRIMEALGVPLLGATDMLLLLARQPALALSLWCSFLRRHGLGRSASAFKAIPICSDACFVPNAQERWERGSARRRRMRALGMSGRSRTTPHSSPRGMRQCCLGAGP